MDINVRAAEQSDSGFAYTVRKRALKEYLEINGQWDEDEQVQLHEKRFANLHFRIIQSDGIDVGIVATSNEKGHLFLYQLFILPEYQCKGIGRKVMSIIIEEARDSGVPLRLRVLKVNPRASSFYLSLGLMKSKENSDHIFYEYLPKSCRMEQGR